QWFEQSLPDDRFKLWWTVRNRSFDEREFQDAFVSYLAQISSDHWTDDDKEIIDSLRRRFGDDFWNRLASATTNVARRRRKPPLNPTESFLVENWKVLRF